MKACTVKHNIAFAQRILCEERQLLCRMTACAGTAAAQAMAMNTPQSEMAQWPADRGSAAIHRGTSLHPSITVCMLPLHVWVT